MTGARRPPQPAEVLVNVLPMTSPQPRPSIAQIPPYVAGRPPAPRADLTTYKLSSNENPYPPLPGVVEAALGAVQTMNRYPDMGSTALYEALSAKLGGADRGAGPGHRLGGPDLPAGAGVLRPRRRGGLRLALVRGVPDRGHRRRGPHGPRPRARRRPSRPRRDGRGRHRAHPRRAGLHPQQPHRTGRHPGRARRVPREDPAAGAGRGRRGVRRVRADGGRDRRRRDLPPPRERAAHPDLLQGLRAGRLPGRVRRRAGAAGRRAARRVPAVRRLRRRAGRGRRVAGARARAPRAGRGPGGRARARRRRAGRGGLGRARAAGQLRLVRAGRAHPRLRQGRRRGRHHGPPVRRRGRPGDHRGDRGQRPVWSTSSRKWVREGA